VALWLFARHDDADDWIKGLSRNPVFHDRLGDSIKEGDG
jgi:hypothetical protein